MTKKFTYTQKNNGDTLTAAEWNNLAQDVSNAVDAINNGAGSSSSGSGSSDSHISFDASGKHNLTIETTAADQYESGGKIKGGKINIESVSDIQLKPGDDIIMYSHHRAVDKQDEVSVKVTDGDDIPVKLQVNAADVVLTTKDKATKGDELNITVNSDTNTRGYLKVRAQAIDLRCEKHGGVALQPKGYDNDGNMNKIKFEHGGGDGLEFGTFNTEKSSLFTDEYRFNKYGVWKMAYRAEVASGKTIQDEGTIPTGKSATGAYKYIKHTNEEPSPKPSGLDWSGFEDGDDFYDFIAKTDKQVTTEQIINTVDLFSNTLGLALETSSDGDFKLKTEDKFKIEQLSLDSTSDAYGTNYKTSSDEVILRETIYNKYDKENIAMPEYVIPASGSGSKNPISGNSEYPTLNAFSILQDGDIVTKSSFKEKYLNNLGVFSVGYVSPINLPFDEEEDVQYVYVHTPDVQQGMHTVEVDGDTVAVSDYDGGTLYRITKIASGNITIDSNAKLKLKGILDFGSSFNFGETDEGIEFQYKLTKKNAEKDCGILKVVGVNNHATNDLTVDSVTIGPGETSVIAQCSVLDIIKLVNYMKTNNQGPWQQL